MTDELQKYHDALLEMFGTEGWKIFKEEIVNTLNQAINSAANDCDTSDKWQYRRGEINKLHQLANYENFIKKSIEQAEQPEESDEVPL